MDRNSAIGLTLIAVLLLLYFNYFSPSPPPPGPQEQSVTSSTPAPADSATAESQQAIQPKDSSLIKQYGSLSSLMTGEEKITKVETADLTISLSNNGGVLREVELNNFKTYHQEPLLLTDEKSNSFSLLARYQGNEVDLYSLYYRTETRKKGDSTQVIFTGTISDNAFVRQTYTIPPGGYQVRYKIETSGLEGQANNAFTLLWKDQIPLQEKDLNDSRNKTAVNYYTTNQYFDGLSETSSDPESEILSEPLKWVSIKQKFFISSIIAKNAFTGGEISSNVPTDPLVVKNVNLNLFIPVQGASDFRYFFGPNKYSLLNTITEGFSNNLYLGWPPVIWVNKFIIIPIFKFLETYIGNYGVIIMILVLIIKIILSPLSYKSYLGMAKMKLLKPELDLLKEKYGDDMAKIQQEQLKLYQQAGVNPFSGCIPLLLQMPILFAMFYFFPVSIELRQSRFLWAEDLSTYDSIINLPFTIPFYGDHVSLFVLLMTASTLVYTWQNNQISSVQGPMKSMSYIMPVVFMFVLNSFSAGLSFYYFVSNLVTFAQQAIIKKFVDEDKIKAVMEDHKRKINAGDGKKSKFMSKLQEAMKASEEARRKGKK